MRITPGCKLCGNATKGWLTLEHTTVWRCVNELCQLQFSDPQLDSGELSKAYSHLYYPDPRDGKGPIFENTTPEFFRGIFKFIATKIGDSYHGRCLDFGCGRGNLARVAKDFGWTARGIENDPEGRRAAREEANVAVYRDIADLTQAEPNERFELITMWQVIEHLREPWIDMERVRSLLKPGGWIVIATPNVDCLKARMLRADWENYRNPTHLYYFNMRSLVALLRKSGFTRADRWQTQVSYREHGLLRRSLQKMLRPAGLNGELLVGVPSES